MPEPRPANPEDVGVPEEVPDLPQIEGARTLGNEARERLRADARVLIAPCTARGRPLGAPLEASAAVLGPEEELLAEPASLPELPPLDAPWPASEPLELPASTLPAPELLLPPELLPPTPGSRSTPTHPPSWWIELTSKHVSRPWGRIATGTPASPAA